MYPDVENVFFVLGAFILRCTMSLSAITRILNKRGYIGRKYDAIRNVSPNSGAKTIQKKTIVGLAVFANRIKAEL